MGIEICKYLIAMTGVRLINGAVLMAGMLLTIPGQAQGAIINAKSVSLADVNSAIRSASDGDTVVVPAGTASWTSGLDITKGITVRGANTKPGDDLTIILDDVTRRSPDQGKAIAITLTPAQSFRMTGITFRNGSTFTQKGQQSNNGTVSATSTGNSPCKSFRIDHCHFDGLYSNNYLQIGGWIYGVVDHCIFDGRNPGADQSILVMHPSWGGGEKHFGDGSWADPPYFGSEKFIFVEDCILNNPAPNQTNMSVDCYGGGRYVSRHNTINNCGFGGGAHGTESSGRLRSGRCNETYNNTLTSTQGKAGGGQLRGGTSLVHDNTINGLGTPFKNLTCYREFWPFHIWGGANGSNPWDLNDSHGAFESGKHAGPDNASTLVVAGTPWTTNQWVGYTVTNRTQKVRSKAGDTFQYASFILSNTANTITFHIDNTYGVPMFFSAADGYEIYKVLAALDQPGRGKGDLLTNDFRGNPVNAAAGNTIAWPHQALEPVYYWNNGGTSGIAARSNYPSIQANRDYYNLGNGFAANSTPPAVSSKYVASLNGQDYSGPYPYPHPLVSRAASSAAVRGPKPVGN